MIFDGIEAENESHGHKKPVTVDCFNPTPYDDETLPHMGDSIPAIYCLRGEGRYYVCEMGSSLWDVAKETPAIPDAKTKIYSQLTSTPPSTANSLISIVILGFSIHAHSRNRMGTVGAAESMRAR